MEIKTNSIIRNIFNSIIALGFLIILENTVSIGMTLLAQSINSFNLISDYDTCSLTAKLLTSVLFVPFFEEIYKYFTTKNGFGLCYTLLFSVFEMGVYISGASSFTEAFETFYLRIIPFAFHMCTFLVIWDGVVQSKKEGNCKSEYRNLFIAMIMHSVYNFIVLTFL